MAGAGGIPTGSVTMSDGVDSCIGALSNGVTTCALTLTTAGERTLTATYGGDSVFATGNATVTHTVSSANEAVTLPTPPTTTYESTADPTYPSESISGTFPINAVFLHAGTEGLTDVYFVVTKLRSENPTVLHYLLNSDNPPAQEGATLSIPNGALPGSSWNNGESLAVTFEIGLMEQRTFSFIVDLYATSNAGGSGVTRKRAGEFLGHFEFAYDPTTTDVTANEQIFLPLVAR